jgi:hypothetical protein
MAGPADISDIVNVDVQIAAGDGISIQSFGDPLFVSTFAANASFPDRVKAYVGTATSMRAALIADGFAANSAPVRQVAAAMVQKGPPGTIYIGRSDPSDLTWDESLTAIWDDATTKQVSLYAFTVDSRDVSDIEMIADWTQPQFALFIAATASATLPNNTPGNVAANLITKGYDRTAIIYHDAAEASNYGPAILRSRTGPYAITTTSGTVTVRIDGGATQTFTLVAAAATLLGSNAEPFAFSDGDELIVTVDFGVVQTIEVALAAATILSGTAGTYVFTNGMNLLVRIDGGSAQNVTFSGTAGSVATTTGAPWALADGETVTFDIDGDGNQVVTFSAADFAAIGAATAAEVMAVYQTQLTGVTVTSDGTDVTVTSNRLGTGSNAEIVAATGGVLVDLGYVVGDNFGTGFAVFLDVATSTEVATRVNAATTGCVAADESGSLRVTSDVIGKSSRVQITGGTANVPLGFNTNEVRGTGDFNDSTAVTATEVQTWLSANLYGVIVTVVTGAIRLTSKTLGTGSNIDVDASAVATELGFSLTAAAGSGDFYNAAEASAAEVATKIAASIVDGTASDASSQVLISSLTDGATSTVEVTGGTLATKLFDATSATGTGVDEDYIDSALVGHCITFPLDQPEGQSTWDNVRLIGIFPDRLGASAATTRATLQNTLKVNTYETRGGRNELHRGMCCFGSTTTTNRFIDQRVSADWGKARLTEAFKSVFNLYAEAKKKIPLTGDGIELFANELRSIGRRGQTNGHWIYDDTTIDSITDTGISIPTIAQQTQANLNNRKVVGFRMDLNFQDAIQAVDASLKLSVVSSAA